MPDAIFLSKFKPLPRILFADDFDEGVNGWCELIGNHDGDLNKVRKVMEDPRSCPMPTSSTSAATVRCPAPIR
jgi:hypothetical protein